MKTLRKILKQFAEKQKQLKKEINQLKKEIRLLSSEDKLKAELVKKLNSKMWERFENRDKINACLVLFHQTKQKPSSNSQVLMFVQRFQPIMKRHLVWIQSEIIADLFPEYVVAKEKEIRDNSYREKRIIYSSLQNLLHEKLLGK